MDMFVDDWKDCPSMNDNFQRFYEKFPNIHSSYLAGKDISNTVCLEGWLPIINSYPLGRWFEERCCNSKENVLCSNTKGTEYARNYGWTRTVGRYSIKLFTSDNRLVIIRASTTRFKDTDVKFLYEFLNKEKNIEVVFKRD